MASMVGNPSGSVGNPEGGRGLTGDIRTAAIAKATSRQPGPYKGKYLTEQQANKNRNRQFGPEPGRYAKDRVQRITERESSRERQGAIREQRQDNREAMQRVRREGGT